MNITPETAVLAAILTDPAVDAWSLQEYHFTRPQHQTIYRAARSLRLHEKPVDLVTVSDSLRESGELEAVGGVSYLSELTSTPGGNTQYYIETLTERWTAEQTARLIRLSSERIENGDDPGTVGKELSEQIENLKAAASRKKGWTFQKAGDLPEIKPDFLIKGYLDQPSLCNFFAPAGWAKTATVFHWVCCVASGEPFHGKKVKQGPVFIFPGEGRNALKRRLQAWSVSYGHKLETLPIFISSGPVALTDPDIMQKAHSDLAAAASELGKPVLVIFDTLARNYGPGDENNTGDMGKAIAELDKVKETYGAAVVTLHHSPKADTGSARGSVALKGAVDWEYMNVIDLPTVRTFCTKSKDFETPAPVQYRLQGVVVGYDEDNEAITGVVALEEDFTEPEQNKSGKTTGKWQTLAVDILDREILKNRENLEKAGHDPETAKVSTTQWRNCCTEEGMPRNRFYDVKANLIKAEIIKEEAGYVFL